MYLTEILQQCAALQRRIAAVYRHLAERAQGDTGTARLWRELALEEETHADILKRELQSFDEADDSGSFLPEYSERLTQLEQVLRELEGRAAQARSLDDALATAVAIEQSGLEDIYDDVVLQSQPAFKLISERIEAALNANIPPVAKAGPSPRPALARKRG